MKVFLRSYLQADILKSVIVIIEWIRVEFPNPNFSHPAYLISFTGFKKYLKPFKAKSALFCETLLT